MCSTEALGSQVGQGGRVDRLSCVCDSSSGEGFIAFEDVVAHGGQPGASVAHQSKRCISKSGLYLSSRRRVQWFGDPV
jgi:hypothetical protein